MNSNKISGDSSVKNLTRVKTIVYCVALALAQSSMVANADSGVGQNTTLGNARHAAPVNSTADQASSYDPDGIGGKLSRTPSGQMYNIPNADAELGDGKSTVVNGALDVGVIGVNGDKTSAIFRQYKDVKSGFAIDSFSLQAEKPSAATFMEVVGGGVGRDDQFYGLQFGKYNDWKVKTFYNETLHVFTSTAKPIWDGVGTATLTLKNGMPAGGGVTNVGPNNWNTTCTAQSGTGTTAGFVTSCFVAPYYGFNTPVTGAVLTAAATTATNGGVYAQQTRQLMALQSSMGYSELSLIRKQGGLSVDMSLTDSLKLFTTLSQEKRKGARPIGMTDSGFADIMEMPEAIDYATNDFKAGLRYRDKLTQFNVMATANIFKDANPSMTVDNPFLAGVTAQTVLGQKDRFSLPPSNQAYGLVAELAHNMPDVMNSRINATVAWNTSRQNEALLPYTAASGSAVISNPGTAGSFNGNYNQWNTSPGKANARIDTKLADLKFAMQPMTDLTVAAKLRYFATENKTVYLMCNPNATYGDGTQYTAWGCTGMWGYITYDIGSPNTLNNRGVTSGYIPTTAGLPTNKWMRNVPWDRKELTPGVSADYTLTKFSSVNAAWERETIKRTNRERDKVWEDKFKFGYTNRALGDATLRVSAEHDSRKGSAYNSSPYVANFSGLAFIDPNAIPAGTALTNYAVTIGDLRKSEFSDRVQNILNTRVNYALKEGLDVGGTYQYKTAHFDAPIGRQRQDQQSLGVDVNYQVLPGQVWYANYSYQVGKFRQANVQNGRPAAQPASYACNMGTVTPWGTIDASNAVAICNTLANNITWAPLNLATVETTDVNNVLALGLKMALATNLLDVNFTRTQAVTRTAYMYDTAGTVVAAANQALASNGMPDNTYATNLLSASLMVPINKQLSTRLGASYEAGKITDWHYTGLENGGNMVTGVQANPVYIDAGPKDYHVTTVGIMLQYKM